MRSLRLLPTLPWPAAPRRPPDAAAGVSVHASNCKPLRLSVISQLLLLAAAGAVAATPAATPAETTADTTPRFIVKAFQIEGATLVPQAQLQAALAPWLNKPITLLHLQHAARTMAEVYRAEGWPVRPQVPTQDLVDGVVTLGVVETRVLRASGQDAGSAGFREASAAAQTELPTQVLLAALSPSALSSSVMPDAGSLLREVQRDKPTRETPAQLFKSTPLQAPPAAPPPTKALDPSRFTVNAFRINGVTLVSEALLQTALAPWLNRPISFADLQAAARALADVYRAQGWLARPQVPAQELVDGVVTLNVVEARLGQVRIDDAAQPLRADRRRLERTLSARQETDQALSLDNIDRAVNLLNNLPGLRVDAVLAPGASPGQTDVVLKPQDQPAFSGSALLDNQGARSTGSTRASLSMALRSPAGWSDELLVAAQTTGAGNDHFSLNYSLPVGYDGWRLAANAAVLNYRLLGEFASAQAEGGARTFGVQIRYPFQTPLRRSVSLSVGLESRSYRNDANSTVASDKRLLAGVVSLSGDATDAWGRGGLTMWSTSLTAGKLDLSANAAYEAADAAGPRSAGRYARFSWSLARLQQLSERNALWISLSGQNASTNLDSSEKFSLGGANGVRAYPGLEGSGDSAWLATAEWRYSPQPGLQITAFYDQGQVQENRIGFVGAAASSDISLKGAGLGLNWNPNANFGLRAQVARRIGLNPLGNTNSGRDSDGSAVLTRPWLALSAQF